MVAGGGEGPLTGVRDSFGGYFVSRSEEESVYARGGGVNGR